MSRILYICSLVGLTLLASIGMACSATVGAYTMVEASFLLRGISGNPFDFTQNDVRVTIKTPAGTLETIPAFYDGGDGGDGGSGTWRVRYTPKDRGHYAILRVERNGAPVAGVLPNPREFTADGSPKPGFVRRNTTNPTVFEFDNGDRYFPLGNDTAWRVGPNADITDFFKRMGEAGENWSRVWMCHWDGKNLDWPPAREGEGYFSLEAARRWDEIVKSAEANGIRFQMTLQHHGQYSTMVDPNWSDNPWNRKNGGFLTTPEEFFTNEHARALTKAKYRYISARYGWSPNIMAWELFNEVEGTDAARKSLYGPIAAWHKEMAAFLRDVDVNHHLITTSSDGKILGLYAAMDYLQPHSYSPDPMAAIADIKPSEYGKPIFLGEIGPPNEAKSDGSFVTTILWASIMSENSGAAQYWFWERMIGQDLFQYYTAASGFLRSSNQANRVGLKSIRPAVKTARQGTFTFGPGGGWGTATKTRFSIDGAGAVEGAGAMPSFFQGKAHREMFPKLEFDVNYSVPGDFAVTVGSAAKGGAEMTILVDGKAVTSREFAASDRDSRFNMTLHAPISAGVHRISLANNGPDWVSITRFSLSPYGSSLHALARLSADYAGLWVYRANPELPPVIGLVKLTGLAAGSYRIVWWDTEKGREVETGTARVGTDGIVEIQTPPVSSSIAAYLTKR